MDKSLRIILCGLTVCLFIGGLFLVFMRDNHEKSSLWLAASQQHDVEGSARQRLDYALAYDPYNPHLWRLVQLEPYRHEGSVEDGKAEMISGILNKTMPVIPVIEGQ